jgi:pimeloyl-ACP methyl ester carboxylesterase
LALQLAGCVPNSAHRTTIGVCSAPGCTTGSIERHQVRSAPGTEYLLGVVEFDDQGETLLPSQMDMLFETLKKESVEQDLSVVVFVHGWQHNGSYDDDFLVKFRDLLEGLAGTSAQHGKGAWDKPRKVVGIYAAWRGKSVNAGDIGDLTFWTRKAAAERVARGSVRELLGRTRAFRDTIDRTTWTGRRLARGEVPSKGEHLRSTNMMTIGHSFGGLIVYTALAQYFTDQAAASDMVWKLGATSDDDLKIAPYGDLVVIVNPAVEAISWEPIRQLIQNRPPERFASRQPPVFVEITSTADDATGVAFPLGRLLNTSVESFTSGGQRTEARTALGHFEPFLTHDLTLDRTTREPGADASGRAKTGSDELVQAECKARAAFERRWVRDGRLQAGWTRRYTEGAVLTHRTNSGYAANNPYWIVQTDKSLIAGHSEITDHAFVDFIRQLYDDLLLDDAACHAQP